MIEEAAIQFLDSSWRSNCFLSAFRTYDLRLHLYLLQMLFTGRMMTRQVLGILKQLIAHVHWTTEFFSTFLATIIKCVFDHWIIGFKMFVVSITSPATRLVLWNYPINWSETKPSKMSPFNQTERSWFAGYMTQSCYCSTVRHLINWCVFIVQWRITIVTIVILWRKWLAWLTLWWSDPKINDGTERTTETTSTWHSVTEGENSYNTTRRSKSIHKHKCWAWKIDAVRLGEPTISNQAIYT